MPWLIILGVIILAFIFVNVRIVPQAYAFVIERLGVYKTTWNSGLHLKIPFIDRVANKVCLKEQVVDFEPQAVITKDNVTMHIDSVLFFTIRDAKLYTYGVDRPLTAIENLTATTMRNIVGDLELDACLTSRDAINSKITVLIDEASDPWGIKVNRVEVKNIMPPKEIQDAMEKQMKAEREKRESILRAEGEKQSKILQAQGERESTIIRAEAAKQATILAAQAEKEKMILAADAKREEKIRIAEGEAQSIRTVKEATADGIRQITNACPSEEFLQIRAMEAFEKAADGKSTKLIIPSNIQGVAGIAAAIKEIATDSNKNN